jgi:curved DNA-binding protein CbpA
LKNYYRTLGVLDDAEDIIIRAAYKALAQRYHPDKWKGDPQEANKRMSDINEAYDVLSDSVKRKKYDEEYFRNRARDESTEEDETDANFISEEDEAWQIALEFFPKIKDEYLYLSKISGILANTYKATILNNQDYKNSDTVKKKLESDYLKRYYGEDLQIQNLVKELLVNGHKKATIKINKIIRALGVSVSYNQIVEKIIQEFPYTKNTIDVIFQKIYLPKLKREAISPKNLNELFKYVHPNSQLKVYQKLFGNMTYEFSIDGVKYALNYQEFVNYFLMNAFRKK